MSFTPDKHWQIFIQFGITQRMEHNLSLSDTRIFSIQNGTLSSKWSYIWALIILFVCLSWCTNIMYQMVRPCSIFIFHENRIAVKNSHAHPVGLTNTCFKDYSLIKYHSILIIHLISQYNKCYIIYMQLNNNNGSYLCYGTKQCPL